MQRLEQNMPTYAIGQQDFKTLRENGSVYVDKTYYIDVMLRKKAQYLFLARPRRFGKSLFQSTLKYFFQGERELFKGLYIDTIDWDWGKYPVLHLDLNTDRYAEQGKLEEVLDYLFSKWEKEYGIESGAKNLSTRFQTIIEAAHEKRGRKVVILVDEYDKPLVGNLNSKENFEYYRAQLASVYSNFKSSSDHIRLVLLTGVSRFGKLSVFSDLNNLNDITFDEAYSDICGITEKELLHYFRHGIESFAAKRGMGFDEAVQILKENYDGYRFSPEGSDIYNPWSILNMMQKERIAMYWNETGKPTIIAEALRNVEVDLEEILTTECSLGMLAGLDLSNADPLALLYQTGYLTIKDYDWETDSCQLGIPNKEVTRGLMNELLPYYVNTPRKQPDLVVEDIVRAMLRGEPGKMMDSIDIFFSSIPYMMRMENENNFHNAVYILLRLIGAQVDTEVATSQGRIDLLVRTPRFIYVIELKFGKDSGIAMNQIEQKEYDRPYHNDHRTIYRIGANFNTETRRFDTPEIAEVKK